MNKNNLKLTDNELRALYKLLNGEWWGIEYQMSAKNKIDEEYNNLKEKIINEN